MLPPAGNFIRPQLQRVASDPLTSQHQATGFAMADQADDGGARIGFESLAHLADHILVWIEDKHARTGELFLRHVGEDLRADKNQFNRDAWFAGGRNRKWLGG